MVRDEADKPVYTLAELAARTGSEVSGDGNCLIQGVNTLNQAESGDISFFTNNKYRKYLRATRASAVILNSAHRNECPCNALLSENPYLTWARVANCFQPRNLQTPGISQAAVVADSASIHPQATIAAGAVIGERAQLGAGVYVGANSVVGNDVVLGESTRLIANVVVLDRVQVGANCIFHPGVVLGSDGFGLAQDHQGRWVKIAQLGNVVIEDDVEIGANTTVDRGAIHDTIIRRGAKLDNQIQVAHNVEIGEDTAIAACTGIAGSSRIGSHCTLAGGVGVVGHVELNDGVHVSAMSLVSRSLNQAGVYTGGLLAMPHPQWQKNTARIKHLDATVRKLHELEKQVEALSKVMPQTPNAAD